MQLISVLVPSVYQGVTFTSGRVVHPVGLLSVHQAIEAKRQGLRRTAEESPLAGKIAGLPPSSFCWTFRSDDRDGGVGRGTRVGDCSQQEARRRLGGWSHPRSRRCFFISAGFGTEVTVFLQLILSLPHSTVEGSREWWP